MNTSDRKYNSIRTGTASTLRIIIECQTEQIAKLILENYNVVFNLKNNSNNLNNSNIKTRLTISFKMPDSNNNVSIQTSHSSFKLDYKKLIIETLLITKNTTVKNFGGKKNNLILEASIDFESKFILSCSCFFSLDTQKGSHKKKDHDNPKRKRNRSSLYTEDDDYDLRYLSVKSFIPKSKKQNIL